MTPGAADTTASAIAAADEALATIEKLDPAVRAFVHVDPDGVRTRARALDAAGSRGVLHGLTVGVKDIFDTADAPTEHGSPIFRARRPHRDATAVALLRSAGAVIVGKTATAELACFSPPATRNPHDHERTPGGSSSGSAAAVAAGMVRAALGTQTAGSISRPASFCGVVGYKPSFGLVSRAGVLESAQTLDTVGVLADSVTVAAHVGSVIATEPQLAELPDPPRHLRVAVLVPRAWADIDDAAAEAVASFGRRLADLGMVVEQIQLPARLASAVRVHRVIMRHELARAYGSLHRDQRDRLSATLVDVIEEGLAYDVADRAEAQAERRSMAAAVRSMFAEADLIVAPAASGGAPRGLASTGDPACAAPWTMVGVPSVTVPAGTGPGGLPVGVSLLAPRFADRLALSVAHAACD